MSNDTYERENLFQCNPLTLIVRVSSAAVFEVDFQGNTVKITVQYTTPHSSTSKPFLDPIKTAAAHIEELSMHII